MMRGKGKALIAILGAGKPSDDDYEDEPSSEGGHGPSDTEVSLAKKMQAANKTGDSEELARCLKAFIYACMEDGDEDEESPDSEKN